MGLPALLGLLAAAALAGERAGGRAPPPTPRERRRKSPTGRGVVGRGFASEER